MILTKFYLKLFYIKYKIKLHFYYYLTTRTKIVNRKIYLIKKKR